VSAVSLRRAEPGDLDFLVELMTHEEVEPYLAVIRPRDREGMAAEIERSQADLGSLAVHPSFRGRRLADEAAVIFQRHLLDQLGYHRLQLEIYGFNERALAHAERAGFIREGVRRKAYWRNGEWVDGVIYGLVREDLEP